jgi:hypothetical protein
MEPTSLRVSGGGIMPNNAPHLFVVSLIGRSAPGTLAQLRRDSGVD